MCESQSPSACDYPAVRFGQSPSQNQLYYNHPEDADRMSHSVPWSPIEKRRFATSRPWDRVPRRARAHFCHDTHNWPPRPGDTSPASYRIPWPIRGKERTPVSRAQGIGPRDAPAHLPPAARSRAHAPYCRTPWFELSAAQGSPPRSSARALPPLSCTPQAGTRPQRSRNVRGGPSFSPLPTSQSLPGLPQGFFGLVHQQRIAGLVSWAAGPIGSRLSRHIASPRTHHGHPASNPFTRASTFETPRPF